MSITLNQIRPGSIVIVRTNFGSGIPVRAIVAEVEEDIKSGRPGIDYNISGQACGSWAYLTQVDSVVKY